MRERKENTNNAGQKNRFKIDLADTGREPSSPYLGIEGPSLEVKKHLKRRRI